MRLDDYFNEIVNNLYLFQKDDLDCLRKNLTDEDILKLDVLLNEAASHTLRSVVQKVHLAPSKDPHDYMSCSIYHWPNPTTIDGLPYVEKDGIDNPESIHGDKEGLRIVAYISYLSSILYYVTRQDKYLSQLIRVNQFWFLNEETKMNPNLRYAQCIPGINDGEPGGIIDYAASYSYALNLLVILNREKLLPTDFYTSMKQWHCQFLEWLKTSEQGVRESEKKNNQGSLYDLLVFNISRFIKIDEQIHQVFYQRLLNRIDSQINSEGMLPLELVRTKTKSYTTMGLKMLLESAILLQHYDYDFQDNEGFKRAYQFISPHYINHTWDFDQIKEFDPYRGYYILYLFSKTLKIKCSIVFEKQPMHWGYILLKKLIEENEDERRSKKIW